MRWESTEGAHSDDVDPFEILAPLAAAATVRIHPPPTGYDGGEPGSRPWGSGFFVAPGWVLTCAHVALRGGPAEGGRREVGLIFGDIGVASGDAARAHGAAGRPVRGVVEWAHPDRSPVDGRWPAPDLALIRLLEPVPHECVWLTERTRSQFTPGQVAFFGSTEEDGRIEWINGRCTILGELGTGGELKLGNQDEIPPGVSGGPMVDLERGEVIGVIKARRSGGRDGGLGLSVLQLRRMPLPEGPLAGERHDTYHRVFHAHDRHHADRHRETGRFDDTWTDAQTRLAGAALRALTPGQRAELLGLLAELPPPDSTRALAATLAELRGRPFSGSLPAPRGWRDGLGLLYDREPGRGELETVLRYAVHAATADPPYAAAPGAEERLLDWVHRTAADRVLAHSVRKRLYEEHQDRMLARTTRTGGARPLPGEPPPASALDRPPRPVVLLEITQHAWEPSRYDWLVYAPQATGEYAGVDAGTDEDGHERPPPRLRAALQEAFRRCDEPGRPALLQAALPYPLLDLPVDQWHLTSEAGGRLGDQRPVVVRCSQPDPAAEDSAAQRERRLDRWEAAHAGPLTSRVLDCANGHPRPLPDAASLAAQPPHAVPVLCRGSGGGGPGGGSGGGSGGGPGTQGSHGGSGGLDGLDGLGGGVGTAGADPTALYQVLVSGHDVVLWRRGAAATDLGCGDFHRGVEHTVAAAARGDALPEALWRLRAEVSGGVPEAFWSSGLALLYADPSHPLPGAGDILEAP